VATLDGEEEEGGGIHLPAVVLKRGKLGELWGKEVRLLILKYVWDAEARVKGGSFPKDNSVPRSEKNIKRDHSESLGKY